MCSKSNKDEIRKIESLVSGCNEITSNPSHCEANIRFLCDANREELRRKGKTRSDSLSLAGERFANSSSKNQPSLRSLLILIKIKLQILSFEGAGPELVKKAGYSPHPHQEYHDQLIHHEGKPVIYLG